MFVCGMKRKRPGLDRKCRPGIFLMIEKKDVSEKKEGTKAGWFIYACGSALFASLTAILGKMGIVNSKMLSKYRKHAFIVILFVAAVITPGQDIFSLALITFPLYLLYEISIRVVGKIDKSPQ